MRLVDADALMQTYAKFVAPSNNSDFENEPTWNDAVSLLESAPTVNAVEVVRCKDCKWYKESKNPEMRPMRFCYRLKNDSGVPVGYNWDDNDFCSYGERREDGKID